MEKEAILTHKTLDAMPHVLKERRRDFLMFSPVMRLVILGSVAVGAAIAYSAVWLIRPPHVALAYEQTEGKMLANSPLVFSFSKPMSRQADIRIEPPITGNWQYENRLSRLHLSRTFRFEPMETWLPDTTYTVTFENLHTVIDIGSAGSTAQYSFTTQSSPNVVSLAPESSDALRPDTQFTLTLDAPNSGLATFDFLANPAFPFTTTLNEQRTQYLLTPTEPLDQGTRYALEVRKSNIRVMRDTGEVTFSGEPELVMQSTWKVAEAPGVADAFPTGKDVKVDVPISLTFTSEPLDGQLETIGSDPTIVGTWNKEATKATFTPNEKLAYATTYTITIPKGFTTVDGGYFEQDASYEFTTIGPVIPTAYSPSSGQTGVAVDRTIRVTFDQQVDHASAQGKFFLSPEASGSFSWDGLTMIFTPTASLALDTAYTVKLQSGIVSTIGQPSNREYAWSFTTQPSMVKLAVPYYHQMRPLSCEVAALRMALAYKGVEVTEDQLMAIVGYDPTPHQGNVWGNPHAAFVGSIDGRQSTTGYGVYWEPIARAGAAYRETEIINNATLQRLTEEIEKGNPIVVWGNAGSGTRVDWYTTAGQKVIAINGEHTRVVKGFVGPKANPTKIIVNDPLYGEITYTAGAFEANWSTLGKNGVIVK